MLRVVLWAAAVAFIVSQESGIPPCKEGGVVRLGNATAYMWVAPEKKALLVQVDLLRGCALKVKVAYEDGPGFYAAQATDYETNTIYGSISREGKRMVTMVQGDTHKEFSVPYTNLLRLAWSPGNGVILIDTSDKAKYTVGVLDVASGTTRTIGEVERGEADWGRIAIADETTVYVPLLSTTYGANTLAAVDIASGTITSYPLNSSLIVVDMFVRKGEVYVVYTNTPLVQCGTGASPTFTNPRVQLFHVGLFDKTHGIDFLYTASLTATCLRLHTISDYNPRTDRYVFYAQRDIATTDPFFDNGAAFMDVNTGKVEAIQLWHAGFQYAVWGINAL